MKLNFSSSLALVLLALIGPLSLWAASFQAASLRDLDSIVLIEGDASGDGRCTGVAVSEQGHILTARHCFQKCMFRQGLFKTIREQGATEYQIVAPTQLGSLQCQVKIDGHAETVVLEATSPGLITRFNSPSLEALNAPLFQSLVEQGFTSRGDFAVIRRVNGLQGKRCRSISMTTPVAGQKVLTIGYPGATQRIGDFNSDGVHATKSEGRITRGIESNACLPERPDREQILNKIGPRFNEHTALMSTVDGVEGASGSPLLDKESGQILGILIQVYDHSWFTRIDGDAPTRRYCEGSTKSLRSSQILDLILQVRPDLLTTLRCSH